MLLAFHKPYGVLSQFTQEHEGQRTLAEFDFPPHVYPIGRLDNDSEGLLLLSDEKALVDKLLNPRHQHPRTYWAQVEGNITPEALQRLTRGGILLKNFITAPCHATALPLELNPAERTPPIRFRANIPTSWIELTLCEGKNRQVRRMTAAVGFPTLRLIRISIGQFPLSKLSIGTWKTLSLNEKQQVFT